MGNKNLLIIIIVMLIGICGILFAHIKYKPGDSGNKVESIFEEVSSKSKENT